MAASTKLLLDFDGVILRNESLKRYQYDRSAMFVSKCTGKPFKESKKFNAEMFPKYGHTVSMLRKVSDKYVTLQDYNDYLYNEDKLRWLRRFIDHETYKHGHEFAKVFSHCEKYGIDWYIFTNAPVNWVLFFSKELGLDIPYEKVIWPQLIYYLKPSKIAYQHIETRFFDSNFVFVDDTEKNLLIPMQSRRWHPVKFRDTNSASDILTTLNDMY